MNVEHKGNRAKRQARMGSGGWTWAGGGTPSLGVGIRDPTLDLALTVPTRVHAVSSRVADGQDPERHSALAR